MVIDASVGEQLSHDVIAPPTKEIKTWDDFAKALEKYKVTPPPNDEVHMVNGFPTERDFLHGITDIRLPQDDPELKAAIERCGFEQYGDAQKDRIKGFLASFYKYATGLVVTDNFTDTQRNVFRDMMEMEYGNSFTTLYNQDRMKPNAMMGQVLFPISMIERKMDDYFTDDQQRDFFKNHIAFARKHLQSVTTGILPGEKEVRIPDYRKRSLQERKMIMENVTSLAANAIFTLTTPLGSPIPLRSYVRMPRPTA